MRTDGEVMAEFPAMTNAMRAAMHRGEALSHDHCPGCGSQQREGYRFVGCAQGKACEYVGCHECLVPCGIASDCGRFCPDHLNPIELGLKEPVLGCLRCESEDLGESEAA